MKPSEKLMYDALVAIRDEVQPRPVRQNFEYSIGAIAATTIEVFDKLETLQRTAAPVQWNRPDSPNGVKHARECNDHPRVRGTDYLEVHQMIGTSGCSSTPEMWTWLVMGVIQTCTGKQLVCPGDWIVEPVPGVVIILTDAQYTAFYN